MSQAEIVSVLESRIGLDIDTIGVSTVERATRLRMRQQGIDDIAAYARLVARSEEEISELIEAVVVHHSWFFREPGSFRLLQHVASSKTGSGGSPRAALRILSIGCSSGEEPYSIAMALLDAGVARPAIHLDALDVSRHGIEKARQGIYRPESFHEGAEAFRGRHFAPHGDGWELSAEVRGAVRFISGNLLDAPLLPGHGPYEFIFCRHVFIYLTDAARQAALRNIRGLLSESGIVVVGAEERALLSRNGFKPVQFPGAFAFTPPDSAAPAAVGTSPVAASAAKAAARPTLVRPHKPPARLASAARSIPLSRPSRASRRRSLGGSREKTHCWDQIGIYGDGTCPELARHGHCQSCPVYSGHGRSLFDRPAPRDYLERWAEVLAAPQAEDLARRDSVVVFRLAGEKFALPTACVREVAVPAKIHAIPRPSSRALLGLVNIMGGLQLCVSLEILMELPPGEQDEGARRQSPPRMVIIERDGQRWAFPAREVCGIFRFDPAEMKPAPLTVQSGSRTFTRGLLMLENEPVGCLDEALLFSGLARIVR